MDEWETVDAAAAGPAAGQLPAAEAEPSADAHAEALWRSLVTDRRYSGTVQMIQNKLRDEKSPKDKLRTSFVAAATGYILPDKITRRALAALPSMEIEEEWASALQPVVKRLGEPEKEKAGGGSSAKPERSAQIWPASSRPSPRCSWPSGASSALTLSMTSSETRNPVRCSSPRCQRL